jgi:hypothetical protein
MAYPAWRTPCRCAHIVVSNGPLRPTSSGLVSLIEAGFGLGTGTARTCP